LHREGKQKPPKTMSAFEISANGTMLGLYAAENKEDALAYYADDAGYDSIEELKENYGEPNVTEVPLPS
jgi:hypothetical protein